MGPSRPGQLDDLRTSARARVAKTSGRPRGTSDTSVSHPGVLWTPRALGPKGVLPRRVGRHHGTSDPGPRRQEQLVEPACPRAWDLVPRDSWSTLRALGPKRDWPGTAGRPSGTSGTGPSHPGQVVDRGTSDQYTSCPGELVDTAGPREPARVARDSWLIPGALGPKRELPGTAVRHPGPRARSESPGRAGGHCGPSGTGRRGPGKLVDTAGPPTKSRVPRDSRSNPQALGPGPETPGTAGRICGPLDRSTRRPGGLLEPAGPRTWA